MRGNSIIVSAEPRGRRIGGQINDTSSPGTIMQIDTGATPIFSQGIGEFQWKAAAPGTDGLDVLQACLLEDFLFGKSLTDAYAVGQKIALYFPLHGDEMNLRCGEVAGTGNTYAIGARLIIDAESGILVPESGSPQHTFAVVLEVITQVVGSSLVWVMII
jgi:hypothetical protein